MLFCIAARALYCWTRYRGSDWHRRGRRPHPLTDPRNHRRRRRLLEEVGWFDSGAVDRCQDIRVIRRDDTTKSAIQINSAFWGLPTCQEARVGGLANPVLLLMLEALPRINESMEVVHH